MGVGGSARIQFVVYSLQRVACKPYESLGRDRGFGHKTTEITIKNIEKNSNVDENAYLSLEEILMSKTTKALTLGTLVAGSVLASPFAMADECHGLDLTGSMAITSEYHFRGIDTSNGAAVQGRLDWMHCPTGFYTGVWGSNAFGDSGGTEVDTYGGWRYQVGDWGLDVGAIGYWFPENNENGLKNFDYVEGYVGTSWKWLSFTTYYADDYFN